MEFELKGALKKYRRMRSWRRDGIAIMALGAVTAPWLLGLGRTDTLLCWLGALTLWMTAELEMPPGNAPNYSQIPDKVRAKDDCDVAGPN